MATDHCIYGTAHTKWYCLSWEAASSLQVQMGAHHTGCQGLQVSLQRLKALLGGTLLPALSIAQCRQLLAQPLCQRLSLHSGGPLILQSLLRPAVARDEHDLSTMQEVVGLSLQCMMLPLSGIMTEL
jgi:hypothetical protein